MPLTVGVELSSRDRDELMSWTRSLSMRAGLAQRARRLSRAEMTDLAALRNDIPDEQLAVVRKILHPQPARRFRDGRKLADASRSTAVTVLIEDSPRANMTAWIHENVTAGTASGSVLTPWATPWQRHTGAGKKPSVRDRVRALHDEGVLVWFDAMTRVLQMSGVGDFRYYDEYDLWAGSPNDLSNPALLEEHVGRVFAVQDELDVPHLAPTVLLHNALSSSSVVALDLAQEAVRRDPDCHLSIAGTTSFWSGGTDLDAHIGALDALAPAGWSLTVVRSATTLPVPAQPEEVHGLCRTTRALSENAPVHISHGDLAGLPAVAAGATSIGTGWDQRQRMCSYSDYGPRDPDQSGGGWLQRQTLEGLLGIITQREADLLAARNSGLVTRLGGLSAPGTRDRFDHHVAVLHALVSALQMEPDAEQRYLNLRDLYDDAATSWPTVQAITGCAAGATEWLAALVGGLDLYATTEGW